ncbi:hypothetical protein Tco_1134741 [Tanacetum coccineum]
MLWSWMSNVTVTFQLGGILRRMMMRQFNLALGLYSAKEMNNNLYEFYHANYVRNRPNNYNPTPYVMDISTKNHYDSRTLFSYTTIKNPIRRLVHRLLTLTITGRYSVKEKVTLADLFYLHNMDGGELINVPWHVARFLCDKAKGELGIARFNSLGQDEIVADRLDDSDGEADAAEVRRVQEENEGSPRRRPNMSFTNKLRVMDDRLGEIDQSIYHFGGEVENLTKVVSGMSEQHDQFYGEFRSMRLEQERF